MATPKTLGNYDYGYQIWVGRNEHSFLFNGMFGQNVLGFFDTGVLLVSNAGNNELFQQSSYYALATKHFSSAEAFSESKPRLGAGLGALQSAKKRLCADLYTPPTALFGDLLVQRGKLDLAEICKRLDGKAYFAAGDKRASPVGVYPLFAQTLQNNFTKGLHALSFVCRGGTLQIVVDETDERHALEIGFDAPPTASLPPTGKSTASASATIRRGRKRRPVLLIRVSFLEAPTRGSSRFVLRRKDRNRVSESPGKGYPTDALASVKGQSSLLSGILDRSDEELLLFRITRILEPQVVLNERG